MGRWTEEDSNPAGMTRIGWDTDTQRYIFRDTDGSIYDAQPGGQLRLVSRPPKDSDKDDEPLRLMPGRSAKPSHTMTPSVTSPTFQDMLPSHMIVTASSSKTSSPNSKRQSTGHRENTLVRSRSTSHGDDDAPKLSLWKSIRRATRSSKNPPPKLADVVHNATHHPLEGGLPADAGYNRLLDTRSDDGHSSRPLPPRPLQSHPSKGKKRQE